MTKPIFSARGMFEAGLHLFSILTSRMLHATVSSLSLSYNTSGTWRRGSRISPPSRASDKDLFRRVECKRRLALPQGTEQHIFPLPSLSHFESEKRNQKHTLSKKKEAGGGKGGTCLFTELFSYLSKCAPGSRGQSARSHRGPHHPHFRFVYYPRQAGQRGAEGPAGASVLTARSVSAGFGPE